MFYGMIFFRVVWENCEDERLLKYKIFIVWKNVVVMVMLYKYMKLIGI